MPRHVGNAPAALAMIGLLTSAVALAQSTTSANPDCIAEVLAATADNWVLKPGGLVVSPGDCVKSGWEVSLAPRAQSGEITIHLPQRKQTSRHKEVPHEVSLSQRLQN